MAVFRRLGSGINNSDQISFKTRVKIEGRENLKRLPREFQIKHLTSTLMTTANVGRKRAIELAPDSRKTPKKSKGKKRDPRVARISEMIRRRRFGLKDGADNPTVGYGVLAKRRSGKKFPRHWYLVHMGTKTQPAQPFLIDSFDQTHRQMVKVFGKQSGVALKRLKLKYKV